jgi:hypothetical protein
VSNSLTFNNTDSHDRDFGNTDSHDRAFGNPIARNLTNI